MGKSPKTTYPEMVEHAVNSAGPNEKLSRRKIKEYLSHHWDVKVDQPSVVDSLKDVMTQEVNSGYLIQEKQSFRFSPKGKKHYAEKYAAQAPQEEEEEQEGTDEEEQEDKTPSKKTKAKKVAAADEEDE